MQGVESMVKLGAHSPQNSTPSSGCSRRMAGGVQGGWGPWGCVPTGLCPHGTRSQAACGAEVWSQGPLWWPGWDRLQEKGDSGQKAQQRGSILFVVLCI